MWTTIGWIAAICFLVGLAVWLARKEGKAAANLEAAKREAKERARASKLTDNVRNMSDDDVRARLRRVSEGHKRNSL